MLATYHIRSLSQAFKSPFPCLSQLAESLMEEYNRNAFIYSSSKGVMYHCAWDSYLHQKVDKPLFSIASPEDRK